VVGGEEHTNWIYKADAKNMEIEGGDTIDRKGMMRLLEVQKLCWMAVPQQLKCQELMTLE